MTNGYVLLLLIAGFWLLCGIYNVYKSLFRSHVGGNFLVRMSSRLGNALEGILCGPFETWKWLTADKVKVCHFCRNHVFHAATVCEHCHRDLIAR